MTKSVAELTVGDRREMQERIELMFRVRPHPPGNTTQAGHLRAIRVLGQELAETIGEHSPRCADQSHALRHVRAAVLWASEAILREGKG